MADPVVERRSPRRPDDGHRVHDATEPADEARFAELRSLLVGPEQRELLTLRVRLEDPAARMRDISGVLPDAITYRANDPHLARALAPSVEEAITASVRRDPRPLADALFPAIGPAIRMAIVHTLASMMDSLNRTIEQSVSWRALQWRWTALRTGKPFAEIVLLNTLQYRVEQVFLIHRETGLLLQHVASDLRAAQDADQISAMLTAIQDFARDSFHVGGEESLDALRIGELQVIAAQGPHAVLAGVVRGTAPDTLRTTFEEALESIHMQLGTELESFRGDSAPFERIRPTLEACLIAHFRRPERSRSARRWLLAGAVVLLATGIWTFFSVRDRQRWNAYLSRLSAEPGIVVMAEGRRSGKYFVTGLRDPLATDPATHLAPSGLPADAVDTRWEPYQALHPAFVTARAQDLLRPPPGVTLAYRDGLLMAAGAAPGRWIEDSERLAPAIAGVRRFEYSGARTDVQLKERIEASTLRFPKGQPRLAAGQDDGVRALIALLTELNDIGRAGRSRACVEVVGHTDSDGSEIANGPLSQARAGTMVSLLRAHPLDAIDLVARGVGSTSPLTPGTSETDKERNRRVSFNVLLSGNCPPQSSRP